MVTSEHVARAAGVSRTTVSRVLNSHPDVSPETRSEVMKSVRELGYVNSRTAEPRTNGRIRANGRTRPSGRTRLIGLAVPDMRNDYVTEIVTSVVEALHTFKWPPPRLTVAKVGTFEAPSARISPCWP